MLTDELVPIEEHWGLPPRYSLLDPAKVLVFDFGSEVYAYSGKNASFEARKVGARLAQGYIRLLRQIFIFKFFIFIRKNAIITELNFHKLYVDCRTFKSLKAVTFCNAGEFFIISRPLYKLGMILFRNLIAGSW